MSVVGIDFGNMNSVIAVARNRGIDVICNEVSNRATPACVSFGERNRFLGESAKTQEISNFRNTVNSLKRLIGKRLSDVDIAQERKYLNCELVEKDGAVAAKVVYLGEEQVFTFTQLTAMLLSKLKETVHTECKGAAVGDVVISVPIYYDDFQRRAFLDACEIAGFNCLKLMNETTASALAYGITKTDLPEESTKPRNVCFVDIGQSDYSVSIASFVKGKLEVKACAFDKHFGGRNFDEKIVDYCVKECMSKYKMDVSSNMKALFRLRLAAERTKKILSANTSFNLTVESIMNDVDISVMVHRAQFEEWCEELLGRLTSPLDTALSQAGLTVSDIDAVEIVGGTTRIPAVKERLTKYFGKELSTTMNQDEAVARGCALQCAIVSPAFKVREFSVSDVTVYPIRVVYEPIPEQPEDCGVEVFGANSQVPSTKLVTVERRRSFDVAVETLKDGQTQAVGKYTVKNIVPPGDNSLCKIKVKVRVNTHGIVGVEGAQWIQAVEEDEQPEGEKKGGKKTVKVDLPVDGQNGTLPKPALVELREREVHMMSSDKLVADTLEQKNLLEETIYDLRTKLQGHWSEFLKDQDKGGLENRLVELERWLYEGDGYDAQKSVYVARLEELKNCTAGVRERVYESEERPRAADSLRDVIGQFVAQAKSGDEKLAHIGEGDRRKVLDKCLSVSEWLEKVLAKQSALKPWETVSIRAEDIRKEREALVKFATPILTQPRPKTEEPKPDAEMKPADSPSDVPDMDID